MLKEKDRRKRRLVVVTFIFEESATVFASELRNVIFSELVERSVEDGSEGNGASAVHRFRFRQQRVSGTMYRYRIYEMKMI